MKAFTLIELIMTLVIIGALVWVGTAATLSGIDAWGFFIQRKEILTDGRMAMDRMIREIRMIRDLTSVTAANSSTFSFVDINGSSIVFSVSSDVINRTENSFTNGLVGNVSGLTFTYLDSGGSQIITPLVSPFETDIRGIRIEVSLAKGSGRPASRPLNLRSEVWPRNL